MPADFRSKPAQSLEPKDCPSYILFIASREQRDTNVILRTDMAPYPAPAARLLALCEHGEHEQFVSMVQGAVIIATTLSSEVINDCPNWPPGT